MNEQNATEHTVRQSVGYFDARYDEGTPLMSYTMICGKVLVIFFSRPKIRVHLHYYRANQYN